MHPILTIATNAARRAGNIILRHMDQVQGLTITSKGKNDFVTEVDRQAEAEIIQVIRKAYPDHGILAEEGGHQQGDEYLWIIDPLDGTTNFLHGFPQFAVSIALSCRGIINQAVVYDPLRNELFTASRGTGALCNSKRMRVSKTRGLDSALLGTGFPFKQPQHLDSYLSMFKSLLPQTTGIRRAGAAALDLAYVAAGRLDGFWEIGLQRWDMAAGALLIQEAGGMVSDFSGGNTYLDNGNIVCGNPKIFQAILKDLQAHLPEELQC